jgi:hypothetical protein
MSDNKELFKVIGEAILLGSIQFSIASVELSSKFSVINFSKDNQTLQNAKDALNGYMFIGVMWTVGVCLVLFANHGLYGAVAGFISNLTVLIWIWVSYQNAFANAKLKNGL